ncbi:MAG: ABC transporter substrate-binding protein [Desulfobacteraceae bacterium]|nr:ABC transporter substrate-binding protein [Desulfobacteraceae bacterium]
MIKKLALFTFILFIFPAEVFCSGLITLKIGVPNDINSLDPHVSHSTTSMQYSNWVLDPLVRWKSKSQFEPALAYKWERLSDTCMRFYLQNNVRFHSRNKFSAQDVIWTFHRLIRSESFKKLFDQIDDIKIIDDYTIDIVSKSSNGLILNYASYIFPMDRKFYWGMDANGRHKDVIDSVYPSFAQKNISGTGPFKIAYRKSQDITVLERFEDYWNSKAKGNVKRLIVYPIKKNDSRVEALSSGKVDVIFDVPVEKIPSIQKNKKLKLYQHSGDRVIIVQLNQNKRKQFKDFRVRKAINLAIDREKIAKKILKNSVVPANQLSPPEYNGHDDSIELKYDVNYAKKLMRQAGYKDGFECTMIVPHGRYYRDFEIGQTIVSMLGKIKIRVRLKSMINYEYWAAFDAGTADMQMIGWRAEIMDSNDLFLNLMACPDKNYNFGLYNSANYCNSQIDKLLLKAQKIPWPTERKKILNQIEKLFFKDSAFIPLHWQKNNYAARKGIDLEPALNVLNLPNLADIIVPARFGKRKTK